MIGAAVLLLFTAAKLWVAHTVLGDRLHVEAHLWLQSLVRHTPPGRPLGVVIVDISDLKSRPVRVTRGATNEVLDFTPRDVLAKLLAALGAAHPAAMAADVDFSVEPELTPEPAFLSQARELYRTAWEWRGRGVPVILGMKRNEALPPDRWLDGTNNAPLAAGISRLAGPVMTMPALFEFPGHELKSLSRALADSTAGLHEDWRAWVAHPSETHAPLQTLPEFKVQQFYVNYTPLKRLMAERVPYSDALNEPGGAWTARVRGNAVIIGDATPGRASDMAAIPGEPEPLPGVYAQACAAYTLMEGRLWTVKTPVGVVVALLLSFAALRLVHGICWRFAERHEVSTIPLTVLLAGVLVGVLLGLSWLLVLTANILWVEVFAVCFVLVLHCFTEVLIGSVDWQRARRGPRGLAEGFIVAPDHSEGGHHG